ncbi:hypothetical protein OPQ81_002506 [Rhizoctonia solani]|nr:hypothetical protein OPQ81_002506 [Rhizoctonia solani]
MPPNSAGCNSTAAATYHEFMGVGDQRAALTALCRTFRHENLVLMLEQSYRYHPAKSIASVRTIPCADPVKLLAKLGQVRSTPSLDTSSEWSVAFRHVLRDPGSEEGSDDGEHRFGFCYSPRYHSPSDDDVM